MEKLEEILKGIGKFLIVGTLAAMLGSGIGYAGQKQKTSQQAKKQNLEEKQQRKAVLEKACDIVSKDLENGILTSPDWLVQYKTQYDISQDSIYYLVFGAYKKLYLDYNDSKDQIKNSKKFRDKCKELKNAWKSGTEKLFEAPVMPVAPAAIKKKKQKPAKSYQKSESSKMQKPIKQASKKSVSNPAIVKVSKEYNPEFLREMLKLHLKEYGGNLPHYGLVEKAGKKNGIAPWRVYGLLHHESNGKFEKTEPGNCGEDGMAMIMPVTYETYRRADKSLPPAFIGRKDPRTCINLSAKILRENIDACISACRQDIDYELAFDLGLVAYNSGLDRTIIGIKKYGPRKYLNTLKNSKNKEVRAIYEYTKRVRRWFPLYNEKIQEYNAKSKNKKDVTSFL